MRADKGLGETGGANAGGFRLRAEGRAGELLEAMPRAQGVSYESPAEFRISEESS